MPGKILLCSNGFSDSGSYRSTPGLIEWMCSNGIESVAHISWAEHGFEKAQAQCGPLSVRRLREAGFTVVDIPFRSSNTDLTWLGKADIIIISGGNPGVLLKLLTVTGADQLIRGYHLKGKPIIGASSGGIVLGTGGLWLTCCGAIKPQKGVMPWAISRGLVGQTLGLHPYALIPHHTGNEFYISLLRYPLTALGAFGAGKPLFIPDGKFVIV